MAKVTGDTHTHVRTHPSTLQPTPNLNSVRIRDSALVAAAQLSHRYIADRFLPDKAIDLVDEAVRALAWV